MRKVRNFIFLALAAIVALSTTSCGFERIDAGYEGIQVNKYGDKKGVDQVVEVTGAVWYNKIRQDIYEVPIFMQDYNYTNMEFKTADMMNTSVSIGVQVSLPEGQTPQLFVKYRNYFGKGTVNLDELMYKHVRKACSEAVGMYDAEELITRKTQFAETTDSLVKATLGELNFKVDDVFLLADPSLPVAIQDRVDEKIKADQIAQQKEAELRQTQADAAKLIAEAEGFARSEVIKAEADAEVFKLQSRELTPIIVQKMFIEKWNGALPQNTIAPKVFTDINGK